MPTCTTLDKLQTLNPLTLDPSPACLLQYASPLLVCKETAVSNCFCLIVQEQIDVMRSVDPSEDEEEGGPSFSMLTRAAADPGCPYPRLILAVTQDDFVAGVVGRIGQ